MPIRPRRPRHQLRIRDSAAARPDADHCVAKDDEEQPGAMPYPIPLTQANAAVSARCAAREQWQQRRLTARAPALRPAAPAGIGGGEVRRRRPEAACDRPRHGAAIGSGEQSSGEACLCRAASLHTAL